MNLADGFHRLWRKTMIKRLSLLSLLALSAFVLTTSTATAQKRRATRSGGASCEVAKKAAARACPRFLPSQAMAKRNCASIKNCQSACRKNKANRNCMRNCSIKVSPACKTAQSAVRSAMKKCPSAHRVALQKSCGNSPSRGGKAVQRGKQSPRRKAQPRNSKRGLRKAVRPGGKRKTIRRAPANLPAADSVDAGVSDDDEGEGDDEDYDEGDDDDEGEGDDEDYDEEDDEELTKKELRQERRDERREERAEKRSTKKSEKANKKAAKKGKKANKKAARKAKRKKRRR